MKNKILKITLKIVRFIVLFISTMSFLFFLDYWFKVLIKVKL